jgi:hypothetical protein
MINNFRTRASVEDVISLSQPTGGKLIIKADQGRVSYDGNDWFGINWDNNSPFYSLNEDSVMMTTVRINLTKSPDSQYHLIRVRFSRGNNPMTAKNLANRIDFNSRQSDSILYLPQGFAITPNEKFRNQQVLLMVQIPVGKRILLDRGIEDYHWFNIEVNRRHNSWNIDWNDDWDDSFSWSSNVEYVMTESGLKRTDTRTEGEDNDENIRKNRKGKGSGYRYKGIKDSFPEKNRKSEIKDKDGAEITKPPSEIGKITSVEPNSTAKLKTDAEDGYLLSILF